MLHEDLETSGKIDQNLDDKLLQFFDETQEYFQLRYQLNSCLSNGYICMAKTRSINGMNSVTRLQYNLIEDSEAKYKVNVMQGKTLESDLSKLNKLFSKAKVVFKLTDSEIDDFESELKKGLEMKNKNYDNLKKRKHTKTTKDDSNRKTSSKTDCESPPEGLGSTSWNQPLNWFGILTPQSLRQCQQSFIEATNIICQLTELQENIFNLISHYRKLKKIKNSIHPNEK